MVKCVIEAFDDEIIGCAYQVRVGRRRYILSTVSAAFRAGFKLYEQAIQAEARGVIQEEEPDAEPV
jgi:hypothetical protein